MTLLEQLGDIAKRGVDLLEEAHAASSLPLPADQARTVRRTAAAFLSPTSHSRYQSRALAAARRQDRSSGPVVALSTAHPSKFGAFVGDVLGVEPRPAPVIAALGDKPERLTIVDGTMDATRDAVAAFSDRH